MVFDRKESKATDGKRIKIGWAQTDITPPKPVTVFGQLYMRVSQYIHDPLTASALALDNGEEQVILVSLDMAVCPVHASVKIREGLERRGIPFEKVSFSVTHTHNSSFYYDDVTWEMNKQFFASEILPEFEEPENMLCGEEAEEFLVEKIISLISEAWERRKDGGLSFAHEYAAVAFNRRPQFVGENGLETVMYGDCSEENFTGFEGGADTSVELMYTWDEDRSLTGVVCNVPCPSQVYELHSFLSADYWRSVRSRVREWLGRNIYILPMCGAAGDLAPIDLVWYSKTNKQALRDWGGQTKEVLRNFDMTEICQSIGERISEAVLRGQRTSGGYIDESPVFRHEAVDIALPIRTVTEEEYQEAADELEKVRRKFSKEKPMTMADLVKTFEPQGVVARYREQKESTWYKIKSHIFRIGEAAFATNPFELFQEYGQRIKARAKAKQVFISQLSNGWGGYLPTRAAVEGGSYSSKAASTICGPEGGEWLVKETLKQIDKLWKE